MRIFLGIAIGYWLLASSNCSAYLFGLKSYDNSLENITQIEQKHQLNIPMVAIILDPYMLGETLKNYDTIQRMSNKIFHVTVSPGHMTASQVAKGEFDEEYLEFFQFVKDKNIKTIFRTMHEMNGNRYPRAGTTYTFKRAWKHVWNLSREVGLDQSQILFDFSLNHRDKVMYNGTDMRCMLDDIRVGCKTWEDYYPGDTYVDIIGFTFYNRGKATSDRAWLRPKQILIDDGAGLLERLQAKKKPVFIDEVGTTKVRYNDQPYEFVRSQEVFWNDNKARKNLRLRRLKEFMDEQPWIKGMIYFNIDYTAGLNHELQSEADRAAIDVKLGLFYEGIVDLIVGGSNRKGVEGLFKVKKIRKVKEG